MKELIEGLAAWYLTREWTRGARPDLGRAIPPRERRAAGAHQLDGRYLGQGARAVVRADGELRVRPGRRRAQPRGVHEPASRRGLGDREIAWPKSVEALLVEKPGRIPTSTPMIVYQLGCAQGHFSRVGSHRPKPATGRCSPASSSAPRARARKCASFPRHPTCGLRPPIPWLRSGHSGGDRRGGTRQGDRGAAPVHPRHAPRTSAAVSPRAARRIHYREEAPRGIRGRSRPRRPRSCAKKAWPPSRSRPKCCRARKCTSRQKRSGSDRRGIPSKKSNLEPAVRHEVSRGFGED